MRPPCWLKLGASRGFKQISFYFGDRAEGTHKGLGWAAVGVGNVISSWAVSMQKVI